MQRISFQELPEGFYRTMSEVEQYINNCGLELRFLELIRYRISLINHCAYCLDMHFKEAIHHGEEPLRLYSLAAWKETGYFSEKEALGLELAERLTELSGSHVDDELYQRLRQHFSKQEIGHLTLAIAHINSWNRITQCFRPEPGKYKVQKQVTVQA
ncbi:AhpD family alkylhydroperoxidase [Anseongella ginsenosidimutans]|uniref:AhpD family alkylhydroperoxidase n=1 Tax=Anseongella ginsenosidimutans TaxID=496056 RepID=A0A4R3KWN7_9SPHI|nr:carboxymuconolactone decarboxylase family protein [Anseongella ginsenosidimutans]QEC51777.1 carboxymuconolactone decarboxylase family protein [Anseongella ginsenosidimutans]TCS89146.1 AhpD family alkylhydroperoxidase [Anseongella ginsenosidimutans]